MSNHNYDINKLYDWTTKVIFITYNDEKQIINRNEYYFYNDFSNDKLSELQKLHQNSRLLITGRNGLITI